MATYLTPADFRIDSTMPSVHVDELEASAPGFLARRLSKTSAMIDARLAKRYAVPFADPPPEAVQRWLTAIVTRDAYLKRGIDPNDLQWPDIVAAANAALAEITEAADSEKGLFELPLRADLPSTSAATKGGPYGYSEASPYVAFDVQRDAGIAEDSMGRGSGDA